MPDAYLKTCSRCDQLIRLQSDDDGAWQSLDLDGGPHDCPSVPEIHDDWALDTLGHPLTCRLDCWWCGEEVFFHTDGHGKHVLFDRLAWPWPVHDCWAERSREERERAAAKLASDLRARGYRGDGRLVGIAPSSVPESIPPRGRTDPPALQIRLSGHDHELVDSAVRQIVRFIAERHSRPPVPFPLPVEVEVESPGEGDDPSVNGEPFTQNVHRRAIDIWKAGPELVARLTQVQLPEAVDVSIRQA